MMHNIGTRNVDVSKQNKGQPLQVVASFSERLGAAIIDGLIIGLLVRLVSFVIPHTDNQTDYIVQSMILYWVLFLFYHSISETGDNISFGKKMGGLKVLRSNYSKLDFSKALQRNFLKYFSQMGLYIGFIMIAFTKKNQGLHDLLSDTIVVKSMKSQQIRESCDVHQKS